MIHTYATDAITITPKGTLNEDGKYYWDGTPVSTKAFVVEALGMLKKPEGEEEIYTKVAFLKPSESVDVGDQITHDGTDHVVLKVQKAKDFGSLLRSMKVWLQ